ncbi:MAG: DUF1080 domain-containing protein [Pirellulales bacterium]
MNQKNVIGTVHHVLFTMLCGLCIGGLVCDVSRADGAQWHSLFDGTTLGKWKPTEFGGEGAVSIEDGVLHLAIGSDMSGITWTGDFPRTDFELELEARRDDGFDFFCGLTFPVGEGVCSMIVGGWGGTIVGLSSVDGYDASENDTTTAGDFESDQWYTIRVQVTSEKIVCSIDEEKVIEQERDGHTFDVRAEMLLSCPVGVATYATEASFRNIRWRTISPSSDE